MNSLFDRWAPRLVCGLATIVPLLFIFDLYDAFDLPKLAALYSTCVVTLPSLLWCLQVASLGTCAGAAPCWMFPRFVFFYFPFSPPYTLWSPR